MDGQHHVPLLFIQVAFIQVMPGNRIRKSSGKPMMFKYASSVLLILTFLAGTDVLAVAPAIAQTADALPTPVDITDDVKMAIATHAVPGMAVVVLKGGRIIATGNAGMRKSGSDIPITLDDQFAICSGSKAMTSTLVEMSVERGELALDSTLGDLFSDTDIGRHMHPGWRAVTVRQLLDHRAGLPGDAAFIMTVEGAEFFTAGTAADKRQKVVRKVLSRAPVYAPGKGYIYTSLDYLIIAEMLHKATGKTWEDLVAERLWTPLGITSGGFGPPGSRGKIDEPWGHLGPAWGVLQGHPIMPSGFTARATLPSYYGPAGGVHMSITDWAKFIDMQLRGDPTNPNYQINSLLMPQSFVAMHQALPGLFYTSGWYMEKQSWAKGKRPDDSGRVFRSLGDSGTWHVDAVVAPEIDFAVIIAINEGGAGSSDEAAQASQVIAAKVEARFLNAAPISESVGFHAGD